MSDQRQRVPGAPPDRRDDVLRAVGARVHVGTNWRLRHELDSGSGTAPSALQNPCAPSQRGCSSRDRTSRGVAGMAAPTITAPATEIADQWRATRGSTNGIMASHS